MQTHIGCIWAQIALISLNLLSKDSYDSVKYKKESKYKYKKDERWQMATVWQGEHCLVFQPAQSD